MNKQLISVNITTYNRSKLLSRCLDSILKQSYENIEIIIVDDFSTDNTEDVVSQYQLKNSRIKYIKHGVNKGNAFARNSAYKACSGYYVAFMDDDDYWVDKDKLAKQVTVFENNEQPVKLGIVCSSVRIFSNEVTYIDKSFHDIDIRKLILRGNSLIYNSTVLTKREIMTELGGFDENLPKGIDSDFYRRCILTLDYDVHFLPDITTVVNEFGDDRMTPLKSKSSLLNDCKSHQMCLDKFQEEFNKDNRAKWHRKKRLLKSYLKLIFITLNPKYLLNILKLTFL